jgi:hypothetical protein
MSLANATLTGSNLVQAYIAADLSHASLHHAKCAYARLNQSILEGADLGGIHLYQASLVKTVFEGAKVAGLAPPFFADRCPGLLEAVRASTGGAVRDKLERFILRMEATLSSAAGGST